MAIPATPRPINLVSIHLDKPRTLRLDFNALRRAETINKRNYMKGESWQDLSISDLTVLLWVGLLHEDPKLTLDAVGAEIHGGNLDYVGECLMQAQSQSTPELDEGATAADPLPPSVTRLRGSISGPSDDTTSD